jgi:polyhydroxybutyrate depolymerase
MDEGDDVRSREAGVGRQERRAVVVLVLVLAAARATATVEVPAVPSAGCRAESLERGRRLEKTIDAGGSARTFILDVPDGVQAGRAVPLLFDFHGFQHSGAGVWKVSKFRDLAGREPFVTVYPDGLPLELEIRGKTWQGRGWQMFAIDGNRDLAFVRALLDELEERYCIDRARVFSTGFSNGGFFSSLLACTMSDRFAAVAPVGGGPLRVPCAPARGVPVLIHHGRQDELIEPARARQSRDDWIRVNRCVEATSNGCERHSACRDGAVVEYCEGDYGHTWPPEATERIWEFFRRHPRRPAGARSAGNP